MPGGIVENGLGAGRGVSLGAGASTRVALNVSTAQLAFQDDSSAAGVWRVVPGDYQIRAGPSSVEDVLVATVTVA